MTQESEDKSENNVSAIRMCHCGRAPWRPNQRNCHFCHREAQKKYKRGIKAQTEAFATIISRLRDAG